MNNDKVGPGEYDASLKPVTRGPTKWVKSEQQPLAKGRVADPGPGHYKPAIQSLNPVYKNNKSSAFASKVPRTSSSAFARNRVKVMPQKEAAEATSGRYKAIANAAISPKGVAQDIEDSDDEDHVPGPGHYYDPNKQTNFKPTQKPQRLQFFGSTVERFTENLKNRQSDEVGPGYYAVTGSNFTAKSIKPQSRHSREIGFSSG